MTDFVRLRSKEYHHLSEKVKTALGDEITVENMSTANKDGSVTFVLIY